MQFYQSRSMYHFYCPQESYQKLIFPNNLNKSLIKCEKVASYLINFSENIENDRKIRCFFCMVIETHNFKTFSLLLYVYQTPQLKNIIVPAMDTPPQFYQPTEWNFLFCREAGEGLGSWGGREWLVISIFFGDRYKPCVNYSYYYK